MRNILVHALVLPVMLQFISCTGFETNPCTDASSLLDSCGVSLPLLEDGTCSGLRQDIAQCVLEHASDCQEVALLASNTDVCTDGMITSDDVNNIPPPPSPGDDSPGPRAPEEDDDACADGEDNDADGYTDCDDTDCAFSPDVTVCGQAA